MTVASVPPAIVVLVVADTVVVVVADGERSASTCETTPSTISSMGPASALVMQPPFASALVNAFVNAPSALPRHSPLTGTPLVVALAWQPSFASVFLPAALRFDPA